MILDHCTHFLSDNVSGVKMSFNYSRIFIKQTGAVSNAENRAFEAALFCVFEENNDIKQKSLDKRQK